MSGHQDRYAHNFFRRCKNAAVTKLEVHRWEKAMQRGTPEPAGGHLELTVHTADLAATFRALGLHNITIPQTLPVSAVLRIDGPGAEAVRTDATVVQMVSDLARDRIAVLAGQLSDILRAADDRPITPAMQQYVDRTLAQQAMALSQRVSDALTQAVQQHLAQMPLLKSRVRHWKIGCWCKLGWGGVVIAASTALTALTWGAAAPAAVVGIARSCVGLAGTIFALAADLDATGRVIAGQLAVLQRLLSEDERTRNTAVDTAMSVAAGLLNNPFLPTVTNCHAHLETYEVKLAALRLDQDRLSPQVYRMMDSLAETSRQALPPAGPGRDAATRFVTAAEAVFELLLRHLETLAESINRGRDNLERWEDALELRPVAEWTQHVAMAAGAVTDLALGMGGASDEAINVAWATLVSVVGTMGDTLIEKG